MQSARQPHHEFAPARWFTQRSNSSIWMTGYRVFRFADSELPSQPRVVDFKHVRALLHVGDLRYTDFRAVRLTVSAEGDYEFDLRDVKEVTAPLGTYWVLMTPFKVDGVEGDEDLAKSRIAEVVGLLGAFERRNAVSDFIFESVYDFGADVTRGSGPSFANPAGWPAPDLSITRLQQIVDAEGLLDRLDEPARNRIRLSFRWGFDAMYADGIDALLKYWVAIETLAMPDGTNIQPLVQLLADAHGLDFNQARETLAIGRLFNLRGKIVHGGLRAAMPSELIDHAANLYGDAIAQVLGAPALRTAMLSAAAARGRLTALGC